MPFCSACGVEGEGAFCASCGQPRGGAVAAPVAQPAASPMLTEMVLIRERLATQRHGIPALLSFFIPGLGQMVKGQFLVGILVMIAAAFFALLCTVGIGLVLLPLLWIAQLYDAYVKPDAELAADVKRFGIR